MDAAHADAFALTYTRERLVGEIDAEVLTALNVALEDLQSAVDDEDLDAIADVGETLRGIASGDEGQEAG